MATELTSKLASVHPVGGLTEIGFGPAASLLLVISHQGRGVIDCEAGERVARDRSGAHAEWFDKVRIAGLGIGPLAGMWISVAGLAGGHLSEVTADGSSATADGDNVTLSGPGPDEFIAAGMMELRAFGFSPDGRFFWARLPMSVSTDAP